MDNKNINNENKKALPLFIILLVVSMLIGGLIGFFSVSYELNDLTGYIEKAGDYFSMDIASWIMFVIMVVLPIVCVIYYKKGQKIISEWDGEDDDVSDAFEKKISTVIWISSVADILAFFLIAAIYSKGYVMIDSGKYIQFFVGIIGMLGIMFETIIIQAKCMKIAKKTSPEKNVSVYDMKFQKKFYDSCDEAEKMLIGKCATKAFNTTSSVCSVLAIIFVLGALVFEISFLPSLAVCIIWIINQTVYFKEVMKYSKSGKNISE